MPCSCRPKRQGRFRRWKVQLNRCVYPATQDRVPPCWFPAHAGLYSLLEMLKRKIGGEYLRVHPGVSALQLFAARLGVSWQDAKILSAHGRALSESALCHAVRTHRQTFCFLDAAHNPAWVRESLNLGGLENVRLFVGERLSYPDERTEAYDPDATYDPLCMAYIENDAPESGLPPVGLSDEAFIRGKTPMTVSGMCVRSSCRRCI